MPVISKAFRSGHSIGFLFFVLLLSLSSISLVNGLKCQCDICHDTNNTCETDGFCFTTTSLEPNTGHLVYQYRCVKNSQLGPPGMPLDCNRSFSASTAECSSRLCCNHAEYCNAHLKPSCNQDKNMEEKAHVSILSVSSNSYVVVYNISILICLVLFPVSFS